MPNLIGRHFRKMNGLGNDFVIFDGRSDKLTVSPAEARAIASRRSGIGFDQLIVLEPSGRADLFMRILNADGSESGACGNATRCVARLIMDETGLNEARIDSQGGLLICADGGAWGRVSVNMGKPRLDWQEIPLSAPASDTRAVPFLRPGLDPALPGHFSAVNMGNPHAVFFVTDADAHDLSRIGPLIERDTLFPERVNVSLAQVQSRSAIKLRVWERGAGITKACGSAACAAAAAAVRADLTERRIAVRLPGGTLDMEVRGDGSVIMAGAIELEYEGRIEARIFAGAAA